MPGCDPRYVPSDHLSAATFAVVDVETTGLDPTYDRVVEIACVRVRGGRIVDRFCSLVDPGREIPPRASAIHGIFDCDVTGAPTLASLRPHLVKLAADAVVVAHNARFDVGFLPFIATRPTICTLQLARRLVVAPNYRNQGLREFLQLETAQALTAAHRAGPDAEVTAALLGELLARYRRGPYEPTVSSVLATLARPARLKRFTFGMHRGKAVRHIPTSYLHWVVATDFDNWPDVRHTALLELRRRGVAPAARARASASLP